MDTYKKAYQRPDHFIAAIVNPARTLPEKLLTPSFVSNGKRIVPLRVIDKESRSFRISGSLYGCPLRLFVAERFDTENNDAAIVASGFGGKRLTPWFQDLAADFPPEITAWFSTDSNSSILTLRARGSKPIVVIRNYTIRTLASKTAVLASQKLTEGLERFIPDHLAKQYGDAWKAAQDKARNRKTDLELVARNRSERVLYYHLSTERAPA